MHARLFDDRKSLDSDALLRSSKALGLDEASFAQCLSGEATDRITADVVEGHRLGVRVTPTFFLGTVRSDGSIELTKRIDGAPSIENLKLIIDVVFPKETRKPLVRDPT